MNSNVSSLSVCWKPEKADQGQPKSAENDSCSVLTTSNNFKHTVMSKSFWLPLSPFALMLPHGALAWIPAALELQLWCQYTLLVISACVSGVLIITFFYLLYFMSCDHKMFQSTGADLVFWGLKQTRPPEALVFVYQWHWTFCQEPCKLIDIIIMQMWYL